MVCSFESSILRDEAKCLTDRHPKFGCDLGQLHARRHGNPLWFKESESHLFNHHTGITRLFKTNRIENTVRSVHIALAVLHLALFGVSSLFGKKPRPVWIKHEKMRCEEVPVRV